jgi:hypothetical protein
MVVEYRPAAYDSNAGGALTSSPPFLEGGDSTTAAKIYPAAYWYAMMRIPEEAELANVAGGRNGYLTVESMTPPRVGRGAAFGSRAAIGHLGTRKGARA